jgi:hypothetical protein
MIKSKRTRAERREGAVGRERLRVVKHESFSFEVREKEKDFLQTRFTLRRIRRKAGRKTKEAECA